MGQHINLYASNKQKGDGPYRRNATLRLFFTIQCFFFDLLTPLPLRVPVSISPPSPVSEFLQRPLDVHSVSHTCHSKV